MHGDPQCGRVGLDVDPNMVAAPRTNPYVRMDGWDEEVAKANERKAKKVIEIKAA